MKVTIVRHGQTNYNVQALCNDDPKDDVHLTTLGREQAKQITELVKNRKFDAVYISELPRTKETAEIITPIHRFHFIIDKRLNDRKTGFNNGKFSDFMKDCENDFFHYKHPKGESFQEEKMRVQSFLEEIKKKKHHQVLIVGHQEINRILFGLCNGLTDQEILDLPMSNCEVKEIEL